MKAWPKPVPRWLGEDEAARVSAGLAGVIKVMSARLQDRVMGEAVCMAAGLVGW